MAQLLAFASILVATGVAVSLLMALPAVALAETAGEENAAGRARVWLAALLVPALAGLLAAIRALVLHSQGPGASPHLGGERPHPCLIPLARAPGGDALLTAFAWLALLLALAAILRAAIAMIRSHLLRGMVLASGARLEADPAVWEIEAATPMSFTAGLLRPVMVISTALSDRLSEAELRAVIAHERAHCRRRDNILRALAKICATLTALTPTAWFYRSRLVSALEEAADDEALRQGVRPADLQAVLVAMERVARRRPREPSLASLLIPAPAAPESRRRRLEALADHTPSTGFSRGRAPAIIAATTGIVVVAVLMIIARQPVDDGLYCAAEQIISTVR